jgi:hypothetical protein
MNTMNTMNTTGDGSDRPWGRSARLRRNVAVVALPLALLLTSCSSQPEDLVPTAVLEQTEDAPYGQLETVQQNLRESLDIALTGYADEATLNLDSDFFNTRHQDISFSQDWPTSLGLVMMHLVSVFPDGDRLVLASKDLSGVCWYVELTEGDGAAVVRYGASNDAGCIASRVDENETVWEDMNFPLSAPVPADAGTGATPTDGTAAPTSGASGTATSEDNVTATPAG